MFAPSRREIGSRHFTFGAFATVALIAALALPSAAHAAVTLGSDLSRSDRTTSCATQGECTIMQQSLPGRRVTSPYDGVVVRWRIKQASANGPAGFRVIRPAGDGAFTGGASVVTPGRNCPDVCVEQIRLPICAGDYIAVDAARGSIGAIRDTPGALLVGWSPFLARGQTAPPDLTFLDYEFLVNADVERDADMDGFGDETQDASPNHKDGTRPACPPTTPPRLQLSLRYHLSHDRAGRRCAATGPVGATVTGQDVNKTDRVRFKFGHRRSLVDEHSPFSKVIDHSRHLGHSHTHRVLAAVRLDDGRHSVLRRSLRFCAAG
jgi:hypothetical protein